MKKENWDLEQSVTEGLGRYGDIESVLVPNIELDCPKEYKYKIDVPEEVLFLCREIRSIGGVALLVGGSVRDTIISDEIRTEKIAVKDYDLEVYGVEAEDLIRIIRSNYEVKEDRDLVGKSFQVLNVYAGLDYPINISLPREDSKVADGHKGFVSTGRPDFTIKEGAQRRDLTINSAAYDPLTDILYDPYGAIKDVINREINVTDEEKFVEDPLRVLRIMQFASRFPEFKVTEKTIGFCKRMVAEGMLDHLSANRVRDEVEKMLLKGERPSEGMKFLLEIGYIEKYWPEFFALVGTPQEPSWHPEGDVWTHTLQVMDAAAKIRDREMLEESEAKILMYSAMCHDLGKGTTTVIEADGRITSKRHEQEGESPTRRFFEHLAEKGEPNGGVGSDLREAVVMLVRHHLMPKEFWRESVQGKNMAKVIRKWARLFAEKGTNWYTMSLLAEADQRGRNGEVDTPMEREEVEDLVTWQLWLAELSVEQQVFLKAPVKIITSNVVRSIAPEKKPGPWIGAIMECVYQDEIDLIVRTPEEAKDRARLYFENLNTKMIELVGDDDKKQWRLWEIVARSKYSRFYLA